MSEVAFDCCKYFLERVFDARACDLLRDLFERFKGV